MLMRDRGGGEDNAIRNRYGGRDRAAPLDHGPCALVRSGPVHRLLLLEAQKRLPTLSMWAAQVTIWICFSGAAEQVAGFSSAAYIHPAGNADDSVSSDRSSRRCYAWYLCLHCERAF